MALSQTTMTIHRQIDPRQEAIRNQILASSRSLIQELGHEAVSMEAIASKAGVSRPTMYRYFASKEHVVCEAALAWGNDLASRIPAALSTLSATDNILDAAITLVVQEAHSNLPMVRATMASLLAIGPAADHFRSGVRLMFQSLMGSAIPAMPTGMTPEMEASLTLLGRVFMADLTLLSVGDISAEQCIEELKTCARRLLVAE